MPYTLGCTLLGYQRSGVLGQEEVRSLENCSHLGHSPVYYGFPPKFLVQKPSLIATGGKKELETFS